MKIPVVSVIIPTYNRANFVTKAVESVLAQTYTDYEIVVVDDGSTDNTREVLEPYMKDIHYINQNNVGVSAARNHGIRESKGKYIAFLDSDDLWLPRKLEKQIEYMEEDIVCFHGMEWFVEEGNNEDLINKAQFVVWPETGKDDYVVDPILDIAKDRHFKTSSCMCSMDGFNSVGEFDENLTAGEDYDWFSRAAMSMRFRYIPESYLRVRFHENQTGLNSERSVQSQIQVYRKMKRRTKGVHKNAYQAANRRLACKVSQLANIKSLSGKKLDGAYFALKAFLLVPSNVLPLVKAGMILAGWRPRSAAMKG